MNQKNMKKKLDEFGAEKGEGRRREEKEGAKSYRTFINLIGSRKIKVNKMDGKQKPRNKPKWIRVAEQI